jgi:hypothetical protein
VEEVKVKLGSWGSLRQWTWVEALEVEEMIKWDLSLESSM